MQSKDNSKENDKIHAHFKSKDKSPLKNKKNFDEGEYVDFTEIK